MGVTVVGVPILAVVACAVAHGMCILALDHRAVLLQNHEKLKIGKKGGGLVHLMNLSANV